MIKVARLSFFKPDHPTGGISRSSVMEVVQGRRWAAPGQEQDRMLAVSGSVSLSVCLSVRQHRSWTEAGRKRERDAVSVTAHLQLPAALGSSARRVVVGCQPEVVSYVSFVFIDLKTKWFNGFRLL